MIYKERRSVYLAFEFERDAQRRDNFIQQSIIYCDFNLEDFSLPEAVHNTSWQREARRRI